MATVGLPVEVSALHGVEQVMYYFASGICLRHSFYYYLVFGHSLNKGDSFLYSVCALMCKIKYSNFEYKLVLSLEERVLEAITYKCVHLIHTYNYNTCNKCYKG